MYICKHHFINANRKGVRRMERYKNLWKLTLLHLHPTFYSPSSFGTYIWCFIFTIWCLLSPPLLLDFHPLFISRQLRDFLPSCIRFCFPKALARKIMINKVKEKEITVEDIKSNTMSKEVGRGNLHRWMVGLPNLTLDLLLF